MHDENIFESPLVSFPFGLPLSAPFLKSVAGEGERSELIIGLAKHYFISVIILDPRIGKHKTQILSHTSDIR